MTPRALPRACIIAAHILGRYALPSRAQMEATIKNDEAYYLGHFHASARHTIQVDFNHSVRELKKEIARGERRAHNARQPSRETVSA